MNNEFDWWLLIVGLVGGAGLVWLMLSTGREPSEHARSEALRAEADWVAARLEAAGSPVDRATVEQILELDHDWETGAGEIGWDWQATAAVEEPEPGDGEPEQPLEAPPDGTAPAIGMRRVAQRRGDEADGGV